MLLGLIVGRLRLPDESDTCAGSSGRRAGVTPLHAQGPQKGDNLSVDDLDADVLAQDNNYKINIGCTIPICMSRFAYIIILY